MPPHRMLSGAASSSWLQTRSDLELDRKGFIRVRETLQTLAYPYVFACGDCASFDSFDNNFPPKAGVYAVRMGPLLCKNLEKLLNHPGPAEGDQDLESYLPQSDFLSLLNLCDGRAIGAKFGVGFLGPWLWKLKDFIDVKWMQSFDSCRDLEPRAWHKSRMNESYFLTYFRTRVFVRSLRARTLQLLPVMLVDNTL